MDRPLEGTLVVAVEQAVAAPFCTARLAHAGARVIKVERQEGDFARLYDTAAKGEASYFAWLNRGKESVVLDFKSDDGKQLLKAMLEKADVFVHNLAAGAIERAGFGADVLKQLNPRLINCAITGYHEDSPMADRPAYDLLIQAESGLVSISGSPGEPGRIGVSVCDISAGLTAYSGVLEALLRRGKTDEGATLDISLFDVAADWMAVPYLHARYGKGPPKPVGLRHPSIAPYGAFPCSDGKSVLIAVQNEREWVRLCAAVFNDPELAELPEFTSNNSRVEHRDALEAALGKRTSAMTSAELADRLTAQRIAFGLINGPEDLADHPAFRSEPATTAQGASYEMPAHPIRWLGESTDTEPAPPALGADTETVTREFLGNTE